MATVEERRKILEMVAEGKLSVRQGAQLLQEGTAGTEPAPKTEELAAAPTQETQPVVEKTDTTGMHWETEDGPNWLHIRIDDHNSGRSKVR